MFLECSRVFLLVLATVSFLSCCAKKSQPTTSSTTVLDNPVYVVATVHLEGTRWSSDPATWITRLRDRATSMRTAGPSTKLSLDVDHVLAALSISSPSEWSDFDALLQDLVTEGDSVGVHGSFCGTPGSCSDADIANQVDDAHSKLSTLLTPKIEHLSGVCSDADWVQAAIDTGLDRISGIVRHCRLSLYKGHAMRLDGSDCSTPSLCHGPYRYKLERLLHPLRTSDGSDWIEHDASGAVLIPTQVSAFMDMDSMQLIRGGFPGDGTPFARSGTLDGADLTAVRFLFDEAIAHAATHTDAPHVFVIGSSWGGFLEPGYDSYFDDLASMVHNDPNLEWLNLASVP